MEWACTVKKKYFDAIRDGRKKYEVRKRVPNIRVGDILFICCGSEVIACEVVSVLKMDVEEAWHLYACKMCVERLAYCGYLQGENTVFLIGLNLLEEVTGKYMEVFRSKVNKNPQWFSKVRF